MAPRLAAAVDVRTAPAAQMTDTLWSPTADRIERAAREKAASIASIDHPGALRWYERFGSDWFTWSA